MPSNQEKLDSVQAWLAKSHGGVLNAALSIEQPAGTSPEWQSTLQAFGIAPVSDEERAEIARMSTVTRGAPLVEVQRVLEVLARNADVAMEDIDWPDDPRGSAQWDRLRTRIVNLVEDSMAAYKAKVLAKRGMFAMAHAAMKNPPAGQKPQGAIAVLLTCKNCGAPRLTDGQFVCDYCQSKF